jgi:hypothetical protein
MLIKMGGGRRREIIFIPPHARISTRKKSPLRKRRLQMSRRRPATKQHDARLEINLGDFTRTQMMKSLRLTINNQIVVQAEDLASGLSDAGEIQDGRT